MDMGRYYDQWWPPAAPRPKPVKGKIGKKFGTTWWGRVWISQMEQGTTDARASRGRAYARADKVYGIKFGIGKITAKIEGSSGEEYNVKLACAPVKGKELESLLRSVGTPRIGAALLNNELPQAFQKTYEKSLISGLRADCTCPDYENPCKHIAALFYVLADEIDQAPQIVFNLKGIPNEKLLSCLQGMHGGAIKAPPAAASPGKKAGKKKKGKKVSSRPRRRKKVARKRKTA